MICSYCSREVDELRAGCCWECATQGECRAASRTVWQHLYEAVSKLHRRRQWWQLRYDLRWAWERATHTGDYAPGGYFEREHGKWFREAKHPPPRVD